MSLYNQKIRSSNENSHPRTHTIHNYTDVSIETKKATPHSIRNSVKKKERKAKKWIRSILFISTSSSELRKVALTPHEKQIPLPHHHQKEKNKKTIRNQRILAE